MCKIWTWKTSLNALMKSVFNKTHFFAWQPPSIELPILDFAYALVRISEMRLILKFMRNWFWFANTHRLSFSHCGVDFTSGSTSIFSPANLIFYLFEFFYSGLPSRRTIRSRFEMKKLALCVLLISYLVS